jgi:hypothetical protein
LPRVELSRLNFSSGCLCSLLLTGCKFKEVVLTPDYFFPIVTNTQQEAGSGQDHQGSKLSSGPWEDPGQLKGLCCASGYIEAGGKQDTSCQGP